MLPPAANKISSTARRGASSMGAGSTSNTCQVPRPTTPIGCFRLGMGRVSMVAGIGVLANVGVARAGAVVAAATRKDRRVSRGGRMGEGLYPCTMTGPL
jgi:hypothetical protein